MKRIDFKEKVDNKKIDKLSFDISKGMFDSSHLTDIDISMEDISALLRSNRYRITEHAMDRGEERAITLSNIKDCLSNGYIIEAVNNTEYKQNKALVLGYSNELGEPIHVVVGINYSKTRMNIITVYKPAKEVWNDKFNIRL